MTLKELEAALLERVRVWWRPIAFIDRAQRLIDIGAATQLHLHGMNALMGVSILPRDVTALKPTIDDMGETARCTQSRDAIRQNGIARLAFIRADVEMRQCALEEIGNDGADRMAIVKRDGPMRLPQTTNLGSQRSMIRIEIAHAPLRDLNFVRSLAILVKRLIVECCCRT